VEFVGVLKELHERKIEQWIEKNGLFLEQA
jgi:hypothetical protein